VASPVGATVHASLLSGYRVLVIEDEYFLADDIARSLQSCGAEILGPVSEIESASRILNFEIVNAAVLDINLKGQIVFPIARALRARNVPFVFTTGYDRRIIDAEFRDVLVWEKPFDLLGMVRALASMVRHV
jgi:DNA-binding response OmpR family regulator